MIPVSKTKWRGFDLRTVFCYNVCSADIDLIEIHRTRRLRQPARLSVEGYVYCYI